MRRDMTELSRRDFVALTAAGAIVTPFLRGFAGARGSAALTAQEIVDRIKKDIGVDWASDDVDTFKAGDPSTIVTGVAVTSMATLDVLQKAAQAGANLIITSAPTFYSKADLSTPAGRGFGAGGAGRGGPPRGGGPGGTPPSPATISGPGTGASAPMPPAPALPQSVVPPASPVGAAPAPASPPADPVYAGKNAFIEQHKLVVFRLTQHWNLRQPDPRALGLAAAMGWTKYRAGDDAVRYDVPAVTLDALATQLKRTLGTRGGIRAVGDRTIIVRKIGLLPGFTLIKDAIAMLASVDVMITGEVQEWESATYAQDVAFAGVKKGFISIGRVVNEAPGMQVCADWLKTLVPLPVRFIAAGDPYWRP
jgi:putative NIF3 family GTP cyclohydrolase 1 type 2